MKKCQIFLKAKTIAWNRKAWR